MSTRLFGILATAWIVLGPISLLWLMGYYALGSYPQQLTEALALEALLGLPAASLLIYMRARRAEND